jgi:hypothetical protein
MPHDDHDQNQLNHMLSQGSGKRVTFGRVKTDVQTQISANIDNEAIDPNTLNSGFFVTVLGVFLAIGSIGYFSFAGGLPHLSLVSGADQVKFVSKADATCAPLWKDNYSNDAALRCYLTSSVERLCDKQERVHLEGVIKRFRKDWQNYHDGLAAALFNNQSNGMGQAAAANAEVTKIIAEAEAAKDVNGKLSPAEEQAFNERIAKVRDDFAASGIDHNDDPRILQNEAALESQKFEVSHARKIQSLIESGYLGESDFGWFPDVLFKKAFANAKQPSRVACS